MKTTPKPSQIAILAGGALLFFFSFLAFVDPAFGDGQSAWSGDFLFPLTAIPALFGLIVAGATAATIFADVKLPDEVIGFSWKQLNFVLAFTAIVIILGLAISLPDGLDMGVGLILSILAAIALVAGTVMELLGIEVGGSTGGSSQTPGGPTTPF